MSATAASRSSPTGETTGPKQSLRIGFLCGDGLPVSGLLTVFRNVLAIGRRLEMVDGRIPAELGYSWRPDKGRFFPAGTADQPFPEWLSLAPCRIPELFGSAWLGGELTDIRRAVVRLPQLSPAQITKLERRIAFLTQHYYRHFRSWLVDNDIDWVFAVNMTLCDSVSVTRAFRDAAHDYFTSHAGGVVYWDHDLFGSCAIREPELGSRFYPDAPNALTPVPQTTGYNRWVVVSQALADEAAGYPTTLRPVVAPNVLPTVDDTALEHRHRAFAAQWSLRVDRPIILNPVRLFRVKGVDVAVRMMAALRRVAQHRGAPVPYLLVFGTVQEDPEYADEVRALIHQLDLSEEVKILDGVPVSSHIDRFGTWRLDEVDLLRLAAGTSGGVAFTPNVRDVETIGLGPALGALAGLPSLITDYRAFDEVYGPSFQVTRITDHRDNTALSRAANEFIDILLRCRRGDQALRHALEGNRRLVNRLFPVDPWRSVWVNLARSTDRPLRTATVRPQS